jgi:DNA polymerase
VKDMLKDRADIPPKVKRLLLLRVEAGKASTKKLATMELVATDGEMQDTDGITGIVQGSFLIHGAHTGRYAGRLVQPQNFIRGLLKPEQQTFVFSLLDMVGRTWSAEDVANLFTVLYEWPIDTISQCMRGFIRAPEGYEFYVVDYTAIEARVLAWVCGEERILRAYRQGLDVYKLMASSLFNIPVEQVSAEQRRIAKNLVLGCGYQLGGVKFVDYSANAGVFIDEKFAKKAVKKYRDDHPNIVKSWYIVEEVAARVIRTGKSEKALKCKFLMRDHWFCIRLPSGREIRYPHAKAVPVERWGRKAYQISFRAEYKGRVYRETTYGGKLIENIVQGIAFDVMCEGMTNAEAAGYPVHGTVHDELITMRKKRTGDIHFLEKEICRLPAWANGIPLNAEGFVCERYRK